MNYEVLIIGGGPAGLSTALHLAKIAPHLRDKILLLEKEGYPRPKLCAGGLTVDAETLLAGLGLDVREVPHMDAKSTRFGFEGKQFRITNRKGHTLRVIRRDEFDAWLAKKVESSAVEIKEGVTVKTVRPGPEGVTVVTDIGDYHARIVIGADGSNGVTRRQVLPEEPLYTARVLEVLTPSQPPANTVNVGEGPRQGRLGAAIFEFSPIPHSISGYIWDFPTQIKGQPMRCWGIYDANLISGQQRPPLKELLREEMSRQGFGLNHSDLKGFPIRCFDPSSRFSVPRVLLVGDAAGTDPLFGEGISFALGYGNWAAKETLRALETGDFSFHRSKFRLARSALGQALFARWFIANIVYVIKWRWFQSLLWRVLKPVIILVAWLFVLNWARRTRF
jgi:flavin-dependent dehydrogenase